jgi:DNA-binding response OmpR family regulator
MLTAHSELPEVMAARDAGITEFVTKPVTPASLYRHIIAIIDHPRQFVRCGKFFGPDRRRVRPTEYHGPKKRAGDAAETVTARKS